MAKDADHCQIGMSSIVLGDTYAENTLECAHHRQLFLVRILNARSSSIRVLFFPHIKMIGDVCIDYFFTRSAWQLSTVRVESLPVEMQRTAALHDFSVVAVGVNRTRLQGLLGRVSTRLLFSTEGVHQPRRALQCSRHSASDQTISS